MPHVRDIIQNRELFHVDEVESVAEVVRRMASLRIGAILVLRNGELNGVFSERDLLNRVVLAGLQPDSTPVSQVMSTDLTTVDETAGIEEALELMSSHNCRHLPVLRAGRLVGFLSMRDLMHFELARKTEEWHHMRDYIRGSA